MIPPREVLDWDAYFMQMCDIVSKRSKDPSTQHGAVLVDKNHRVVSTGYNGGCRKINDNLIDWSRPNKYSYILHAEENALWTSDRKDLEDCTIYVTGPPCSRCMLRIVHAGVSRIVYGPRSSQCVDKNDWEITENIARLSSIRLESYGGGDFSHFCSLPNGRT
jgi:dCMP deaminase